jgi:hypothetical protein
MATETKDLGLTIKQLVEKYGEDRVRSWGNRMARGYDKGVQNTADNAELNAMLKAARKDKTIRAKTVAFLKTEVKAAESAVKK